MTSTRTKKSGMFYFAHNYRELLVILAFLFETDFEDDIVGGIVRYESNYTSPSIKIGWNEPEDPNGLVIKYLLEYRRSDNASLIIFLRGRIIYLSTCLLKDQIVKECIRRKDLENSQRTKIMTDLLPGNYCVQVRAVSLAGTGKPTKEFCFLIEVCFIFSRCQKFTFNSQRHLLTNREMLTDLTLV
jgi:hypothetical protein